LVGGKIIKDGNCGPKAISEHLYGHHNRHERVRANVVRLGKNNYYNYGKRMVKDGYLFTHREFYFASQGYDFPIILFWCGNKMAFFDRYFDARTAKGREKTPLFIL
jgi:hypothetical protein